MQIVTPYITNRLRMSALGEVLSSLVPLLEQPSESVFDNIWGYYCIFELILIMLL